MWGVELMGSEKREVREDWEEQEEKETVSLSASEQIVRLVLIFLLLFCIFTSYVLPYMYDFSFLRNIMGTVLFLLLILPTILKYIKE